MINILTLPANTAGLDYFTSDVHGSYEVLQAELARIKFDGTVDRLFCCGDIIDQGDDSPRCLGLLDQPWFYMTTGDHEQLAMFAMNRQRKDDIRVWSQDGGSWFYKLTAEMQQLVQARYQPLIDQLPFVIEVEQHIDDQVLKFGILHAELPEGVSWSAITDPDTDVTVLKNHMLYGRRKIKAEDTTVVEGIDIVVSGHTPQRRPTALGNQVFLDAGSAFTDTISVLTAREIVDLVTKQ